MNKYIAHSSVWWGRLVSFQQTHLSKWQLLVCKKFHANLCSAITWWYSWCVVYSECNYCYCALYLSETINSHQDVHSDIIFEYQTDGSKKCLLPARHSNSSHCLQFYMLLKESFCDRIISRVLQPFSLVRSEPVQSFLAQHIKQLSVQCNPWTEDGLGGESGYDVFNFNSRALMCTECGC
jgi:hypothetical protein